MPICAMVGCSRTYRPGEGVRLFSLPKVITTQCKKTEELSSKRRATWLSRINRNMTGKKVERITVKVCGRHFITGQPSALFDFTHPDWAPTLNLGYEWKKGESNPFLIGSGYPACRVVSYGVDSLNLAYVG